MKAFLPLCVIFALAFSQVSANCSADCPDTEEVIWALDDSCLVFRNKCYFDKAHCYRDEPLTITTKAECQNFCRFKCQFIYDPVVGTYKGESMTFGNKCEMETYNCFTGETYV
ncbi:uncharacterized protein Dwil_GK11647 [Drosophila willistoni]|uniref:Kazal-like domain-containing protein n=1 Tax=Drosophila willistoni TaxID=7260 RepID=B4N9U0_DROWI|nr:uncharacterized protein LOC6647081 [Drosophila willistoni]EDW80655.2 uncharacterized protein Dwil_GK11647 [Drosophila willistoni]